MVIQRIEKKRFSRRRNETRVLLLGFLGSKQGTALLGVEEVVPVTPIYQRLIPQSADRRAKNTHLFSAQSIMK